MATTTLEKYQWWVFITTFVNYAFAHWTRKCYTNVAVQLKDAGVTTDTLAMMASGFMFTYSAGSFVTGMLGDRYSPVAIIGIGLIGSSAVLGLIVVGASTSIVDSDFALIWFAGVQILHGFFQATGGPVNTAIMNNWWPKEGRGKIFGFWTCHQYAGDIVAAFAGAAILDSSMNWRYAIIIPMVLNGIWSFVNFMCVPSEKKDVPALAEEARLLPSNTGDKPKPKEDAKPLGILEAFAIPNVLGYALAFGFFKLINYAMFFQLPLILSANFDSATASLISSLYSFGMMPGGVICGWMSDIYGGRRACVCATMMAILVPLLLLFAFEMDSMNIYVLLTGLCVMGCLVGGPNNIITSAVAADLADTVGGKATGTITGLINGSGSCTAAFGQLLIPILAKHGEEAGVGYRYVWLFLVVCTILGTLLLGPKIKKELAPPATASTTIGYQAVELKTTKMAV
jgi:sugar phosphate permease